MSKILAVFGATGKQGSSVVDYVLNDAELSKIYKIRALTRNLESEKAKELVKKGVEVVQGDAEDPATLKTALAGAHTTFAMTTPHFGPNPLMGEYNKAKDIADAAVQAGVEYFIFSTLPPVSDLTGGKYTKVFPFDAKAKAEKYIRGLPIRSSFYCPGSFMENFQEQEFLAPQKVDDSTWALLRPVPSTNTMPLIDAVGDSGKFVGAILADPEKYEGQRLCAAERFYSMDEIVAAMSKSAGKKVVYKQVTPKEFDDSLATFGIPGPLREAFASGFPLFEEIKYYGPGAEEKVAWAAKQARGKPTTLEEFFQAHPFQLQ